MNYKTSMGWQLAVAFLGVILAIVAEQAGIKWLMMAGGGLILGSFILHFLFYRCPCCRKHLGRGMYGESCPHCGKTLRERSSAESDPKKE